MTLYMSNRELVQLFRQAKDPAKQIRILADLNLCHWSVIVEVLRAEGIKVNVRPRRRKKAVSA